MLLHQEEAESFAQVMFIKDMLTVTTSINFLLATYVDERHAVKVITYKHIHVKLKAKHFGKCAHSLCCRELDENIDTTLASVCLICSSQLG